MEINNIMVYQFQPVKTRALNKIHDLSSHTYKAKNYSY